MFWRDITLSVWRKKTTGLKTKKRLLPLVLAAALCSSPVWAEEATFTANFKDTDLKSFIETVGANLNKTIIMGQGVQGKVSIRTMTPLNERQYYQLFLNLLEAQGYAVVPMENDVLKVVKSSAAKVEPLPLVGEGSDNYAGDEMVTKVVPVLGVLIDAPGYQFMQRRQGQWSPVSSTRLSAQVTVPKQVQMLLQPGSDIWQKEYALELQRRRLTLHDIELELQKEAKKKTPQIRFSPFEPATPFTLRFYSAAQNACWAVKLAHDGALSLNQCDERMP
ncbi:hypothetical protein VEE64_07510 [Escherichia coli]|nr:hypothetical protein VEE64_07510 [Escherichia coli]